MKNIAMKVFATILVGLVWGPVPVWADFMLSVPPAAQHVVGKSSLGPYKTWDEANAVNLQYFNGGGAITGSASSNESAVGGSSSSDPRLQAAAQLGQALGVALHKAIFGDPEARRNEAIALNDQGIQNEKMGQWGLAVHSFEAALAKSPEDPTIQKNLDDARQTLAQLDAQAEKERQEAIARQKQETYDRLSSQLKLSGDNGGGLSLKDVRMGDSNGGLSSKDVRIGNDLKDAVASPAAGTNTSYAQSDAAAGDLRPGGAQPKDLKDVVASLTANTNATGPQAGSTKAGDQLKSAAASDDLTKNFDAGTGRSAGHLDAVTDGGRTPIYAADMDHPQMAKAQGELNQLQNQGDELRAKLEKLTNDRNHATDAATMKELSGKVDQAQKEYGSNQSDIANKKDEIEKIHQTIDSDRELSPPPAAAGDQNNNQGQ